MVDRPLRPVRPPRRRAGDLTAVEFGGVGLLELLPPLVQLGLAHREGLVRCRRLAMCDAGELDVLVYGQVDHLACCPGRWCQPAQCRPFIAALEPEVKHDAGPQPQGLQRDRDEPPFEHEALAVGSGSPNSGIIQ
jgi:hypothetical protein